MPKKRFDILNWQVPEELRLAIIKQMDYQTLVRLRVTCKKFLAILNGEIQRLMTAENKMNIEDFHSTITLLKIGYRVELSKNNKENAMTLIRKQVSLLTKRLTELQDYYAENPHLSQPISNSQTSTFLRTIAFGLFAFPPNILDVKTTKSAETIEIQNINKELSTLIHHANAIDRSRKSAFFSALGISYKDKIIQELDWEKMSPEIVKSFSNKITNFFRIRPLFDLIPVIGFAVSELLINTDRLYKGNMDETQTKQYEIVNAMLIVYITHQLLKHTNSKLLTEAEKLVNSLATIITEKLDETKTAINSLIPK